MNDLDEIRALRARFDDPPAGLARARARVLAGTGERPARRAWVPELARRAWVPVLAGLVVAGVVAAVAAVGVLGRPDDASLPPGGPAVTAEPEGNPVDVLVRLALTGPMQPAVRPGQRIRSEVLLVDQGRRTTGTSYYEVDGLILTTTAPAYVQQQRTMFAERGPSLLQPTPAYLTGLAADPVRLRAMLLDAPCPPAGCTEDMRSWHAWNLVSDLVRAADVIVPPQLRSALLRVLVDLPGVTVGTEVVEGAQHTVLRITGNDDTHALVLGEHARIIGEVTVPGENLSLWTTALVD